MKRVTAQLNQVAFDIAGGRDDADRISGPQGLGLYARARCGRSHCV